MKRLFILIAAVFAAASVYGQTPLPNDPAVKTGKLENGMTYYIRHNDKPAQRAERTGPLPRAHVLQRHKELP